MIQPISRSALSLLTQRVMTTKSFVTSAVALAIVSTSIGCIPQQEEDPPVARIEWALSLNGQPATCEDYQISTAVVYVAGTGAGPCERSEDFPYGIECKPLKYEVPCEQGGLEEVFDAPVDVAHKVSLVLRHRSSHLGDLYLARRPFNLERGGVFTYPVERATLDVSWSLQPQPPSAKLLVQFYDRSYQGPFSQTGSARLIVPVGLSGIVDAYSSSTSGAVARSAPVTTTANGASVVLTQPPAR